MTAPADDLACKEFVEIVTAYLDGALAPAERARFEEHMGACPGCDAYLDQMRKTIAAMRALTAQAIAPETKAKVLDAFRKRRPGGPPSGA